MDKRREELEKKRSRLVALRQEREERKKELLETTPSPKPNSPSAGGINRSRTFAVRGRASANMTPTPKSSEAPELHTRGVSISGAIETSQLRRNIDQLVEEFVPERASSTASSLADRFITPLNSTDPSRVTSPLSAQTPTTNMVVRPVPKLTTTQALIYDIPPQERVMYSKESQTTLSMADSAYYDEAEVVRRVEEARQKDALELQLKLEEENRIKAEEEAAKLATEQENEDDTFLELTEEEKTTIFDSENFKEFLDNSSRIIERALGEKYDFMIDYTAYDTANEDSSRMDSVKRIALFADDRITRHRSVMDIHWSPNHSELLLGAYNKNVLAANEPDGLVAVWNLHLADRPEFTFHAQSDVLTAKFSAYHPHLILGGTYSGQVVIWDTRSKSKLPVLASPLTSVGHTHPVYSVDLIGTHQTLAAVSASTDGMVCTWQLDMLAQPQDILELSHTGHPRTDEVAVTKLGFLANETATFLVGTEEGTLYHAHRYERAGNKAGIHPYHSYKGHTGPITGLSCHPTQPQGTTDYSDLFLTSSFDWSVKLWRAKSATQANPTSSSLSGHTSQTIQPIHSFEHGGDYVYDVQWSPTHPALFGVVDGCGHFDLWNLNVDTEAPIVSTPVSERALNKLSWHKDGNKVAVGASDGQLCVYELGDMVNPSAQDWEQLQSTLTELSATSSTTPIATNLKQQTASSSLSNFSFGLGGHTSSLRA